MANAKGIDVSHWQGDVDWQKIKADGVTFAFVKATEGTTWVDPQFSTNWDGMQAAGIQRGAYHFLWPTLDAATQAEHFVQTAGGFSPDDLPPVLDLEKSTSLSPADLAARVKAWLDRVEQLTGRKPMIYTGAWYWNPHMVENGQPPAWTGDYDLWVANYSTTAAEPFLPTGWSTWAYWQYDDQGGVDGISGYVDLDRRNG